MPNETPQYRAYLCCGPNCTLKRSLQLLALLEREVARAGLGDRVEVLPGGCMKHCESGPTLTIWPGPVYYQEMSAERLRIIVAQHFGQGRPVTEYFWVDPITQARDRIRARPQPPAPTASPSARPAPPLPKKRPNNRPSWRSNDGDVDDFKW